MNTIAKTASGVPVQIVSREPPPWPPLTLTAEELAWLDEYRRQLLERFPGQIEDIVVYGSRARGIADAELEYNVLVIISKGDRKTQEAIGDLGYDVDIDGFFVAPAVVVYTGEEWAQRKRNDSPVYRRVGREGISVL
jgi:predicted nucleotidyltransferase